MTKALVLLSGGIDSTVCTRIAIDKYGRENVKALTMYYGQKHSRELESARKITSTLGVSYEILPVDDLFKGSGSSLIDKDRPHPEKTYDELDDSDELSAAYVPFRNGLFLSIAAVIAQRDNFDKIVYGPHIELGGTVAYPDCSPAFNEKMSEAIRIGTDNNVQLETPLQHMTKTEVVEKGLELNAPLHLTWTCYYSGNKQCGKCPACKSRIRALEEAGAEHLL